MVQFYWLGDRDSNPDDHRIRVAYYNHYMIPQYGKYAARYTIPRFTLSPTMFATIKESLHIEGDTGN